MFIPTPLLVPLAATKRLHNKEHFIQSIHPQFIMHGHVLKPSHVALGTQLLQYIDCG